VSNTPPIPHTPIIPGSVLAGKYRVERIIGQGGMGLVVEARHIALDERVALKFLLPEYAQHPEAATRFIREARAAAKIKSEHVARVSDVGNLDSGAPYMMMEFLEGADLSQTLEKLGVLPVEDAIDYIIQGCEAIAEAHQHGIVHRDLKPANLFLSKRPDGTPIVKVLDFGISKVIGGAVDNLTKTTAAMGSALYMSPEQMQQTRAVDHRTDIYALGIALYELLAGKQPYYADTLPQLCAEILTGTPTPIRSTRPEIPEELAQVMEKAYARDKGQRYQSIADLVIALAPFAPARSQNTIDRVARMAGLPIPIAGSGQRASSPSAPPRISGPPQQGGTQMIPQQYTPPQPYAPPQAPPGPPATVALPVMDPTAGGPPPPGSMSPAVPNANQIVPGHYQAPQSSRASAAFRQGPVQAQTDGSMSANGRLSQPSSGGSKAGVVIAILGVLAVGGAAAVFFLRGHHDVATTGGPGPEKTVDTAIVAPPNTIAPPATDTVAPPTPADIKSAAPAVSAAEPPVKAGALPAGNGRVPGRPAVPPPATHAPAVSPTPPVATPPTIVKPPVDPLAPVPGGRQGSLWEPSKDRQA
jgi:eukaryotic-like serine/threonine-protein kinase